MLNSFLFIGLPYLAIVLAVTGSLYRVRYKPFSYSALTSQLLEDRKLRWGSLSWHLGIIVILLVHLLVLVVPGPWSRLLVFPQVLWAIEASGIALAGLCLLGLTVLIGRRLTSASVQAVTSVMDLVVLGLLFVQVALGVATAITARWGTQWSPATTVPYLWSVLLLQPDASYIVDLPLVVRTHIAGAWLLILLLPFSRLLHLFAFPWRYVARPPQKVVWGSSHPAPARDAAAHAKARREFVLGGVGMALGGIMVLSGTLERVARFVLGPHLTPQQQSEELSTRLARLQAASELKSLELERVSSPFIMVAAYSDLQAATGKYFIDYQMRPAMAFLGADGLPLLLSAKCTHLGCTVGNTVTNGLVLCPCHVSHFNITTGQPTPGSPAKLPLPLLGWVLKDAAGKVIASKAPGQPVVGQYTPQQLRDCTVFIAKSHAEVTA